jgi:hypothetical protein
MPYGSFQSVLGDRRKDLGSVCSLAQPAVEPPVRDPVNVGGDVPSEDIMRLFFHSQQIRQQVLHQTNSIDDSFASVLEQFV